jgi:hypothetical protein
MVGIGVPMGGHLWRRYGVFMAEFGIFAIPLADGRSTFLNIDLFLPISL